MRLFAGIIVHFAPPPVYFVPPPSRSSRATVSTALIAFFRAVCDWIYGGGQSGCVETSGLQTVG